MNPKGLCVKKLMSVAVILACLSVAYCFGIFLPRTHTQINRPQAKSTDKADLEAQEKCSKLAKEFFDEQGFTPNQMATYTCHYSKKENKFFILMRTMTISNNGHIIMEFLCDILTRKELGNFTDQLLNNKTSYFWTLQDKTGDTEVGWKEAIKPYMED